MEAHVRLIDAMAKRGFLGRFLISHDAGWYSAGEPGGAAEKIRPYTAIADQLEPALKSAGFTEAQLRQLLIDNPREAFSIRVRKC